MTSFRWPNKRSVGSSYCFDQSPGAERLGGLAVTLRWRGGDKGTVTTKPTSYFRDEADLDELLVVGLAEVAEEGVREAAAEMGVDLNELDVTLSEFLYHDVDSSPQIYRHAAGSAFRAAFDAWQRWSGATAKAWAKYRETHGLEQ
jgi:L-alanine-DL-glutamate epimerase-like enolase superfamily enzyme